MRPSAIGAVPAGIRALKASCQAYHPSASTSANKDDGKATLQTGQLVVTRRAQLASLVAMGGSAFGFASVLAQPGPALATEGSPVEQALQGIKRDFVEGQYYVTGNITRDLYAANCVFKDPTVTVTGVEPYAKAIATLFDPAASRADLISIRAEGPSSVVLRWRLEGALQLGGLKIKPYTGTTVYILGDDGKIVRHEETWDISTLDAFLSTLVPSFGAPPAPPVAATP